MKRAMKVGMGVATAIAVSLPAMAWAQEFPPPPPSTYYGTVTGGAVAGQGVIAIVQSGTASQTCGDGKVLQDGGSMVYVVDVVQDAQKDGCGESGRSIRFYFTPNGSNPGRLATETAQWGAPGAPKEQNLTLGVSLTVKGAVPVVARDGIQQ
ncbi:MAG: hypothetical protein WD557_08845 [Dehalococcoidia bacterium]